MLNQLKLLDLVGRSLKARHYQLALSLQRMGYRALSLRPERKVGYLSGKEGLICYLVR